MKAEREHPEVIYLPEKQPRSHRTVYQLITALAWAAWIYLILPSVSLLTWWLGAESFQNHVLSVNGISVWGTFLSYGVIIIVALICMVAWSKYNIWRSRYKKRPGHALKVTPNMMCERFGVDRKTLGFLHTDKTLMMDIDDSDVIYLLPHTTNTVSRTAA